MRRCLEGRREMPLQPEQLRGLHLGRDDAADIVEHLVLRLVDEGGFRDGAVVHPDDDVALRIAREADAQRSRLLVEHDERAGGVEADALDGGGRERRPLAIAARIAATQAAQMSEEDCSTMSPASCHVAIWCRAVATSAPFSSKMPARALAVPTSTPMKACMSTPFGFKGQSTSRCSRHPRERSTPSSGSPPRRPGTTRPRRSPRPCPCAPSACRRSRRRTSWGSSSRRR